MRDFEYLKSLNFVEVEEKTHLDARTVKAIANKDFASLKNANINMNLKILEREYDIDFTEFKAEFEQYLSELEPETIVIPAVAREACKKEFQIPKKVWQFLPFAVIFCLVLFAVIFFYSQGNSQVIESAENKEIEQSKIISNDELKEKLKQKSAGLNNSQNTQEQSENYEKIDEKIEEKTEEKAEEKVEEKAEQVQELKSQLQIKANKKVWMYVKDLKTLKSKNYMLEKSIVFDRDCIINTGNTDYQLWLDGEEISVPKDSKGRYILLRDNKVSFLSRQEFSKLNK